MENPLNQFAIHKLIPLQLAGHDISFTNSSLFLAITFLLIVLLFYVGTARRSVVPGRLQSSAEMLYEFTANMVEDNAGHGSQMYVPFVMSIFLMVLFDGLIGGLLWGLFLGPWVRKKLRHHESDDDKIARLEKQVRRLRRQMRRIKTEEKDHAAS